MLSVPSPAMGTKVTIPSHTDDNEVEMLCSSHGVLLPMNGSVAKSQPDAAGNIYIAKCSM